MAVMTWDEQAQAFVDAKVPMTYNPAIDAWEETEGYAYNPEAQAWEERWNTIPNPLVLYENGDENTIITGGWRLKKNYSGFTLAKYPNYMRFTRPYNNDVQVTNVISHKQISLKGYNYFCLYYKNKLEDAREAIISIEGTGRSTRSKNQSDIIKLDCSDLNGLYTLNIIVSNDGTNYIDIYKIWLE